MKREFQFGAEMVDIYTADDGTVSDRQAAAALARLGPAVEAVEVFRRAGRHRILLGEFHRARQPVRPGVRHLIG